MSSLPDISVVMSVYNGAHELPETMESILLQQDVSLEFIIIDDGSTDGSNLILDSYASRDARVRILHQEHQGLTCALIKGCSVAKGEYIARQDVGDISLPNRLRLQEEVFDQHQDCTFVSCWISVIGPKNEYLFTLKGRDLATGPIRILSKTGVIDGPTHHGSVMFRRAAYMEAGGYRGAFYFAQDWDLWYRLAALGTFMMIKQCLLRSRITPSSISALNRDRQIEYARLSRKSFGLRSSGHSDDVVLQEAERLHPHRSRGIARLARGRALYFIGKCLVNNKDMRATRYFLSAIFFNPFLLRAWWWAAISLARHGSNGICAAPRTDRSPQCELSSGD